MGYSHKDKSPVLAQGFCRIEAAIKFLSRQEIIL